jgi:antitoxin ParD1/3/4
MSKVEKISIALTSELAEAVRVAVDMGDYASSSEVIREALRDWTEKREARAAKIADLRAAIQSGLDSGVSPRRRTAEEIIAEGRRRLATKG